METKRKSSVEERNDEIKKRHINLLKIIEERAAKMQAPLVPFLSNDLIFQIFLLLPVKSLLRFTSVCKAWYKLIHCAEFVEAYSNHAEATPILLRRVHKERANTFHVETHLRYSERFCMFPCSSGFTRSNFIHFLDIKNEKCKLIDLNISCSGSLVATCNGLILITSANNVRHSHYIDIDRELDRPVVGSQDNIGRLIVMNPLTRKLIGFPMGTLPSVLYNDSYGLVFSHTKGVYKVVHLVKDKSGHITCEILSLQTRSWKAVDGPQGVLFTKFGKAPIATVGALHWLPGSPFHDYIITMGADDEKFSVTDLPMTVGNYDRLIEMGGFLTLVKSLNKDHIEVWVLKGLDEKEWVKQHTIHVDGLNVISGYVDNEEEDDEHDEDDVFDLNDIDYSIPSFALSAKELVFRNKEKLYSYDFELEEIKEIKMECGKISTYESIMPHYSNLSTWESLEPLS